MELHHFGIAVKSISKSVDIYRVLGYQPESELIYDESRNINILFMKNEVTRIELIEKSDSQLPSPIDTVLDKRSFHCIYHTCYSVQNLEQEISRLRKFNFVLVQEPAKAIALGERQVCFLFHTNIGIIELLEK